MATPKATFNKTITNDEAVVVVTWPGFATAGDIGDTQCMAQYSDKTFIVTGTFGGGTVLIEGSNDGTNWVTLTNRQGNPMSFTAAGMNTSQDKPAYIRPNMTAGAAANINVSVACHRADFAGLGR